MNIVLDLMLVLGQTIPISFYAFLLSRSSTMAFQCDLVHEINSFGLAYDFNKKSSVLINYQILNFSDKILDNSFSINQFFVLVQIKF